MFIILENVFSEPNVGTTFQPARPSPPHTQKKISLVIKTLVKKMRQFCKKKINVRRPQNILSLIILSA